MSMLVQSNKTISNVDSYHFERMVKMHQQEAENTEVFIFVDLMKVKVIFSDE